MDVFYALAVLACPVGMGLMMWFMMRAGKSPDQSTTPAVDDEVTALRVEVDQLRAERRQQPADPVEGR